MKNFAFFSLFSLFLCPLLLASDMLIDQQAPNFSVKGHDGEVYQLEQLRGSTIILEWYNRDCPFVRKFYNVGEMQRLQQKYAENAVWFKVVSSAPGEQGHMDAAKTAENLKKENSHVRAVLIDEDGTVGRAFSARTTPQIVIIDGEGVVRYNGAIDSIPSTNPDDISKARNYLVQAMNELIAGKEVSIKRSRPYGCSVKYKN